MAEGKEGDWDCSGCNNRNYAFRSFCNRCKQPRFLVDSKTPADSKWLPRIGDWICTGCTNNNYASRETCKKCGKAKEVAAMPAIAMPGASLPTYAHYFSRAPGGLGNIGSISNGASYQPLPLASVWPAGGVHNYAIQSSSAWPFVGTQLSGSPLASPSNHPVSTPKGWRNGDWLCDCGFHNYSSRAQCKNCNASVVPALGTKRLASEGFSNDWENKRLNSGNTYVGFDKMIGATGDASPNWRAPAQFPHQVFQKKSPHQVPIPALLGKGAKQWRNGDWMCTNCNNHNYASRSECNRCKTSRDAAAQPFLQPVNVV